MPNNKLKEFAEFLEVDLDDLKGVKGDDGERGEKGDKGERGEKGEKGNDGKDGKDGKNGRDGRDGKDGKDGKKGDNGKDGSPDSPEQVRDKLESLKGKNRLNKNAIDGLEEMEKDLNDKIVKGSARIVGGRQLRAATFTFTGDGSTTEFLLPKEPSMKGLAVWVFYNGQWLQNKVHYNIAKKTMTTTFTPENGTILEGFLILF